jgi:hypothetical protein
MKYLIIITTALLFAACGGNAEQDNEYDVFSYRLPQGWTKEPNKNGMQFYAGNPQSGEYAVVIFLKATDTNSDADQNFTDQWAKLVKGTVNVSEESVLFDPETQNGWSIVSGYAPYTDGANKGTVTQRTATGYGKVANIIMMTNTEKFTKDMEAFLASVKLKTVK